MVTTVMFLWTLLGGAALGLAGKEVLSMIESDLAGYVAIFLFGPVAWFIGFIALASEGLDTLVRRFK